MFGVLGNAQGVFGDGHLASGTKHILFPGQVKINTVDCNFIPLNGFI